ncbi:MAG: hypothetical protein ACLRXB_05065 [Escherichia coli]
MVTPDMFVIQKSEASTANEFRMVLGAQDKEKRESTAVFSADLYTWSFHGEIAGNGRSEIDNAGYM